jgi:hypothetical protein
MQLKNKINKEKDKKTANKKMSIKSGIKIK